MRGIIAIIGVLLLTGCPQSGKSTDTAAKANAAATDAGFHTLTAVFSATESDPWTSELITALGVDLGFDPWAKPGTEGTLDIYGPYDVEIDGRAIELTICLAGFTGVVDILGQEALGDKVREWLDGQAADVVWLDGDPLQFQVGRKLAKDQPLVFTGVVIDRSLYYGGEQMTTGVYRRYSLPRILGEIWRADQDATRYALLSDDAPSSKSRVHQLAILEPALPEGQGLTVPEAATSWAELKQQLADLAGHVDAAVICGAGEDGASADFLDNPCPPDLLSEAKFPVVVLSPSKADHAGAISLQIKPSAHAKAVLELLGKVLGGQDPRTLPILTPDDMAVFLAVGEEPAAPEDTGEAAEPATDAADQAGES
ncbi:hypothetical protein JW859_08570 [bacterium]|nr:hypothetical protein [bacterium]